MKWNDLSFSNNPMRYSSNKWAGSSNLDDRLDYGEERFVTFGILEGRVVVVVHTENDNSLRIISIRRATKYEEKTYFSELPD